MSKRTIAGGLLLAAIALAGVFIPRVVEAAASPYCVYMQKYCPALYARYCK
jgi:hypothetical protein